ncbi:MAG: DHH family phosphoesterase [Bacteroidales bacterium]|nr:DHH family phosphoesterase [Bacteroidales bacterium]
MKTPIENIKDILSNKKRITLFLHLNPDGDSIGSSLALQAVLEKIGHQCTIISSDFINNSINWLPGVEKILIAKRCMRTVQKIIQETEVFFCADFNQLHRIGTLSQYVLKNPSPRILIDHHIHPNPDEFQMIISDTTASSTAELVFRFLNEMSWTEYMDNNIATCLYVGIITDTGSLSYSCSHCGIYQTIAKLMEYDVNIEKVRIRIFGSYGESHHRIYGYALQKMKILTELRAAYIILNKEELKRFNYHIGDTEGLANECISLRNIVFGCLISEREGGVRISFRSRGDFDVNVLARQEFEGGGHKNASGADSSKTPEETGIYLEEILQKYKDQLLAVEL